MRAAAALMLEAVASARSQIVPSALTIAMIAGMCVAALLTTGRTVAAEDAVLAQLDAVGTRSIVVRADETAGVTTSLLDHLDAVDGVEAVTGFGPIVDARNALVPDGQPIAVRRAYGELGDRDLESSELPDRALASAAAAHALGLYDGTGGVTTAAGRDLVLLGGLVVPGHLSFLEPLVVVPSSEPGAPSGASSDDPLSVVVVLADAPEQVAAIADTVRGLLAGVDHTKVTVETSQQLADIRSAISGELGSYGRATVLGILAISAVLVAVNLLGLVVMRRKDFGRRRALGATQGLIIGLLLTQVGLLGVIGAIVGVIGTTVTLVANGQPVPDLQFTVAVGVAAVLTALVAALLPALVAARRDPLHELRVP
ncbi:MAG: FtsX-like permease family protein [Jiangellaceae bacterium]